MFKHYTFMKISTAILSFSFLILTTPSAFGWKFLVCGDSRGNSRSQPVNTTILSEVAEAAVAEAPAFVLFPGDLVYAASPAAFTEWKAAMAPVYAAGIPVYPVMGNHERGDVNAFISAFGADIPDNGPSGEINRTYALTESNALILALDVYVTPHRVNQSWINSLLATNLLPHVFVIGHEPAFKVNHADTLDDYPAQRDTFWRSLASANVAAYFCGHDHFYDHCRLDDGDGNPSNDIHQFIVGTGGAPLYGDGAYNGINSTWTPQRILHESQYGYMVIEINGMDLSITWKHRVAPGVYQATTDVIHRTVSIQRPILSLRKKDANVFLSVSRLTPDSSNVVQHIDNLTSGIWKPLFDFTASSNSYERLISENADRYFYRLKSHSTQFDSIDTERD